MSEFMERIDRAEQIDGEGCHDDIRTLVDAYEHNDPERWHKALGRAISELIERLT